MSRRIWKAMGIVLAVLLVGSVSVAVMAEANPEEAVNTLRVYGRANEDAGFWDEVDEEFDPEYDLWDDPVAPLSLAGAQAPRKDFVVWNPAYLDNDGGPNWFRNIKADGVDANQKVFLRQWYVPELTEPLGTVWTEVTEVTGPHIVMEYTYMLLDADNNPTFGHPTYSVFEPPNALEGAAQQNLAPRQGPTAFALPIASRTGQIGLDSFDATGNGVGDVSYVRATNVGEHNYLALSTGRKFLQVGDWIEYLDHKVQVIGIDEFREEVLVDVWYTGRDCGVAVRIGQNIALQSDCPQCHWSPWQPQDWLTAGRKDVFGSLDGYGSEVFPTSVSDTTLDNPWFLLMHAVTADSVTLEAGRLLERGESFFVDGAEYFVSAIYTTERGSRYSEAEGAAFKYITIRNPLCKVEDNVDKVPMEELTLDKCCIDFEEFIPFLPPFNMTHDIVDDVNVPTLKALVPGLFAPDQQLPDNVVDEGFAGTVFPANTGLRWGADSFIHELFNTVAKRIVRDQPPAVMYYVYEEPEPRFDTSLAEAWFTVPTEATFISGTVQMTEVITFTEFEGYDDVWYGPTSHDIVPCDAETGDEVPEPTDVTVTVNGVPVIVYGIGESQRWVDLGTDAYDGLDIEITYCYWGTVLDQEGVDDQIWQWINIETKPWLFTEFVMPQWDNKAAEVAAAAGVDLGFFETGDYILVSSFLTEDSRNVEHGDKAVRVKFAFDAAVGFTHSADVYVNDAEYNMWRYGVDANSLRLYDLEGDDNGNALWSRWTYDDPNAPFDPRHAEAPTKDFLIFNPAYQNHRASDFFEQMRQNGNNANQKVFLRQYYAQDLTEPLGWTWTSDAVTSDHIVKEYTFVLLNTDDQPVASPAGQTSMVLPIADQDPTQIGLDSYDVKGDGVPNITNIADVQSDWWGSEILLETNIITAETGDTLRFLDHRIEIGSIYPGFGPVLTGRVNLEFFYMGYRFGPDELDDDIGVTTLFEGDRVWAGRHGLEVADTPWFAELVSVQQRPDGTRQVQMRVGRYLREGESFFVDGTEYFVAKLHMVDLGDPGWGLKYITLRNPLCKDFPETGEEVILPNHTVRKTCVPPMENIPFLPPFNMTHDIRQDIGVSSAHPTGIWVEDRPAIVEYYIDEAKEPRFDTNFLEEKFTYTWDSVQQDYQEDWRWINIETRPWDYTEFVLPDVVDGPDYLLVSSWITQDSTDVWPGRPDVNGVAEANRLRTFWPDGAVRVMFEYDAVDGTGIYVNTIGIEVPEPPAPLAVTLSAEPMEVVEGEVITFTAAVTGGTGPFDYEWDFGDEGEGELVDGGEEFGVYRFAAPGTYTVTVTVEDAEADVASDSVEVEVLELVELDIQIFLPIVTKNFSP